MKQIMSMLPVVIGLLLTCSCKKEKTAAEGCFADAITVRVIADKPAIIKQPAAGVFYIVEQGAIDTKLNPCNLPAEFKVSDLAVIISGQVKATVQGGPGPCCTEDFIISNIRR